jgi:sugar lactone lactonase YvrE
MKRTFLLLAVCLALPLRAQSIFTVAGGGNDDGRLATEISFNGPRGLAFDPSGKSLYVAERFQGIVRKIDLATSRVETIAGIGANGFGGDNGPAKKATLNEPRGLFTAPNGDLYIADFGNNRVRKIDAATGIITTVAGGGPDRTDGSLGDGSPATSVSLRGPWGVWIRGDNLYLSEARDGGLRIRKIVISTGIISTVAGQADGTPGFEGDGGSALLARFRDTQGIAVDPSGNIFIADSSNNRVRWIDATTGKIDTYAGGGNPASGNGDGGPATQAKLDYPTAFAFDATGSLVVTTADSARRIDKTTRQISTVAPNTYLCYGIVIDAAGNIYVSSDGLAHVLRYSPGSSEPVFFAGGGLYVGDGLVATAAILSGPQGVAIDGAGNVFIADAGHLLVRRVDAKSGLISTYAGDGSYYDNEDPNGKPATSVSMAPFDLAFAPDGSLFIADAGNNKIKRVDAGGTLTVYAGGGNSGGKNDGVAALAASFGRIRGISFNAKGDLYIADADPPQVWRIDAATKIVSLVAGSGKEGLGGDGGPAKNAELFFPESAVEDVRGNVYIADLDAIRRVTPDGTINLFTKRVDPNSASPSFGDGGPVSEAYAGPGHMFYDARTDSLFATDPFSSRVRKIDLKSGIITTVAGSGVAHYVDADFTGDNGRATAAKMNFPFQPSGVAVRANGDLAIADTNNNRVRMVFACGVVTAPALSSPADAAAGVSTAPTLTWADVPSAFRYDVFLDTVNPPARIVAADVSENSFTPANLLPATKYFWRVVAKGDSFCTPLSTAASSVASFTTSARCEAGAFDLVAPANGAASQIFPTLSWEAAPGAGSYDVYAGTTNPPALFRAGVKTTSVQFDQATVGVNYWFVVAHAACDATRTSTSPVRTFISGLTPSPCEQALTAVTLDSPAANAAAVSTSVVFQWRAAGCAIAPFDLYLGTSSTPPIAAAGLTATSQEIDELLPGTAYFWRVVARTESGGTVSSPVASFTTRACAAPGPSSIVFAPAAVTAGTTYTIVWSPAAGLDADGGYLVERSLSPGFGSILDAQVTSSTAASFVAESSGTIYHRVRAIAGCDPARSSAASETKSVAVSNAKPNVIFTVQPTAVITSLGERLEDQRRTFTVENLSSTPQQVILGRQELNGSPPFFSIIDPLGQDVAFVTLEPRKPRTFEIRYSGPRNDTTASYQGVVFLASTGAGLAVTPYAFVNLKVGAGSAGAPQFVVDGTPVEYVAFPGLSGDDASRPALQVGVRNNGAVPMEVGFDIGPEVWLTTDGTWNATAIPPGATRVVNLLTRRSRAPNGSPLPRYTYLTARTRDGASTRLLVQDSDALPLAAGRATRLDVSARSFLVPEAVSRQSANGVTVTRLRLTNVGGDAVQAELVFTPAGADGFTASAQRAVVVVPANDVVTLTDPIVQIFRLARPAAGQIEVRLPEERVGLLAVSASTVSLGSNTSVTIPVFNRGDGARSGSAHVMTGLTNPASLVLAETSGTDHAAVNVVLIDDSGAERSSVTTDVPRYGYARLDNVFTLASGRIEIRVTGGGGSVAGVALLGNAAIASRPAAGVASSATVARFTRAHPEAVLPASVTVVVPIVPSSAAAGAAPSYATRVSLAAAPGAAVNFAATFRGATTLTRSVSVPGGTTKVYNDIVSELFSLPSSTQGSVFIDAPGNSLVSAVLQPAGAPAPSSSIPLPTTLSEALTSAAGSAQRPLFVDGLEQSTDPARGTRWMMLLNEVAGSGGTVNVKLYEAGNRSVPIADQDFTVSPYGQLKLDTVFKALGLDAADRRKDRVNVAAIVTARAGGARVAASAVAIDNVSGDTKVVALTPSVGSATPSVSLVTPVVQAPTTPPRRRSGPR